MVVDKQLQHQQESITNMIVIIKQKMFEQTNDPEQIQKKQAKLFEQKRKYKNLESDKKTYIDESVKVIKKQKTTIEKIKKQNDALKDLISKMNKQTYVSSKSMGNEQTKQQILDEINQAIYIERESQKSIDIHISNFQKKITEKRKNCMGMNSGAENQSNLQKQIKILENRLDKANQKFNETTANNKELKVLIDSFRRERVIFDNLYKKLEKELHEKRKKMADIIEKANNAYEERDKAHNQIQTMKIQAKKQASEFQKQIKEMTFLMQKMKLSSYGKKQGRLNDTSNNNFYETDNLMGTTENRLNKQTKKNAEQIQKIHKFREDFAKIQAATEIQKFDELLRIFSQNEEKNFQMFKFVNLQSNEIQELEAEVFQLKKQLKNANFSTDDDENKDNYVLDLERHLIHLKSQYDSTKKQYERSHSQIRPLIGHIERVFETIECDRELVKQLAGNKVISENNLYIFLAIIEHKAIQIVNTFKQLANPSMLDQQPVKPASLPAGMLTFDDFEDNEEYNKLLTAEELREKAKDFIEREQNHKQKKKEVRGKKK